MGKKTLYQYEIDLNCLTIDIEVTTGAHGGVSDLSYTDEFANGNDPDRQGKPTVAQLFAAGVQLIEAAKDGGHPNADRVLAAIESASVPNGALKAALRRPGGNS